MALASLSSRFVKLVYADFGVLTHVVSSCTSMYCLSACCNLRRFGCINYNG